MLDGQKDSLDVIVRAFAKVCDEQTRLRVIGVDKEEFKSVYPGAVNELDKCGDHLNFMGMQSHFDTIRYVLGGDCYIFIRPADTRNNAGFPTKFAEAITCGVQMIASNVSDVASFANGKVILLGSLDESKIADAMKQVKETTAKTEINDTFDYRNYQNGLSQWTTAMLNGGGNDAGK